MNRLKELREEANLTLRELGLHTGIAFTSLQLLENDGKPFREEHLEKLSLFFGVSKGYILGESEYFICVVCDDEPNLDTYIYKNTYDKFLNDHNVVLHLEECNIEIKTKGNKNNDSYFYLKKHIVRNVTGINKKMQDAIKGEILNKLNNMNTVELKKLNKFIDDFMK